MTDEVSAIIADDEPALRAHLKSLLAQVWPELVICGEARNGREALDLIETERPAIAFLDIRMPGLSGMDVARTIGRACHVVFVTAYDQYAAEAFEQAAVDYLLKPVERQRLEKTAARLKERTARNEGPSEALPEILARLAEHLSAGRKPAYLSWIRVARGDGVRLVAAEEVCYFKAEDKYTLVVTPDAEALIRKPVKDLAAELDPRKFWQIHRGTIVNVDAIAQVSRSVTGRGTLRLKNRPESLAVSRRFMHLFQQM